MEFAISVYYEEMMDTPYVVVPDGVVYVQGILSSVINYSSHVRTARAIAWWSIPVTCSWPIAMKLLALSIIGWCSPRPPPSHDSICCHL